MGLSRVQSQILWATATSKTLSSSSRADSDAYTFDSSDVGCSVQIKVDNQGTPQAGDVLNVYIKWTNGDVTGAGGSDVYDSDEYAQFLCVIDTVAANTPGEDPAIKTVPIDVMTGKGFKLSIDSPNAGTRNMVVNARLNLTRAT
jgi:hypothetical protein